VNPACVFELGIARTSVHPAFGVGKSIGLTNYLNKPHKQQAPKITPFTKQQGKNQDFLTQNGLF